MDPRWRAVQTFAPYLVLALLVPFTIGIEWPEPAALALDLALCVVYAAWVFVFRTRSRAWNRRPLAIGVFLGGLVVLNGALVLHSAWFGILVVASFVIAYSSDVWPGEIIAVAAIAAVAGYAQGSTIPRDSALDWVGIVAIIAINVVCMSGLSITRRMVRRRDEQAGIVSERSRLAREIHDTLAQDFAGIVTQLQAADEAADDGDRRRHLDSALALARDGLAEARRSVNALRPAALESRRLGEALVAVTDEWSARTGIPVTLTTSGDGAALSTDVEVVLLRTAQEALTNVERHAAAHHVTLELRVGPRRASLRVDDDGRGFDRAGSRAGDSGFGLIGMRERVESIAGALTVDSEPGRGTAIEARVPV